MNIDRGLSVETKRWVYGWYSVVDGKHYIIPGTAEMLGAGWEDDMNAEVIYGFVEVIGKTVGRSVVVEGKVFFEGDIIEDDTGDTGVVRFGELPLDKSGDCVCTYPAFYIECSGQLGQAPTYDCTEIGEWMTIIGTIYDKEVVS